MAKYTINASRQLAATVKLASGCTMHVSGKGDWIKHKDGKDYEHFIQYNQKGITEATFKVFNSRKELCEHLIDKGADYTLI